MFPFGFGFSTFLNYYLCLLFLFCCTKDFKRSAYRKKKKKYAFLWSDIHTHPHTCIRTHAATATEFLNATTRTAFVLLSQYRSLSAFLSHYVSLNLCVPALALCFRLPFVWLFRFSFNFWFTFRWFVYNLQFTNNFCTELRSSNY